MILNLKTFPNKVFQFNKFFVGISEMTFLFVFIYFFFEMLLILGSILSTILPTKSE